MALAMCVFRNCRASELELPCLSMATRQFVAMDTTYINYQAWSGILMLILITTRECYQAIFQGLLRTSACDANAVCCLNEPAEPPKSLPSISQINQNPITSMVG